MELGLTTLAHLEDNIGSMDQPRVTEKNQCEDTHKTHAKGYMVDRLECGKQIEKIKRKGLLSNVGKNQKKTMSKGNGQK